ncbi:MAG: hypothetical protein P8N76_18315 [Pirellulaceae bacterium]|nr:hypothetical protein [Pirellulaceae bacterium]
MATNDILRQLRCPICNQRKLCGPEEMLQILRDAGMLRREAKPDWPIMLELFSHHCQNLRCRDCGHNELLLEEARDDFDFDDSRACEVCRKLIPPERIEIFPNAQRCATCQDKPSTQADDFCSRCGGLVSVRTQGGAGVSRYVAVCADCGLRQ